MKFLTTVCLLISISSYAQTEFNHDTYVPTYTLPSPEGWGIERFGIPIEFAPTIPYKGVEDVRFAPGWGDAKTFKCVLADIFPTSKFRLSFAFG